MTSNYDDIIIRDNFNEDKDGQSRRSAASVDIIPFGQELLTWKEASDRYGEVLCDPNNTVVTERNCNCYVRGKNLSSATETQGTVRLFLLPFSVFCNPKQWYKALAYDGGKAVYEQPMITMKSGNVSEKIGPGEVCINKSAFLLSDDYHLKKGEHYCLCAIVSTPAHPVEIPTSFKSNIEVDKWIMDNPNITLLNVHPIDMRDAQTDYMTEFGNNSSEAGDFMLEFQFYCDYAAGERWPTDVSVRVQCSDSSYQFDYSDLKIQTYQQGTKYQTITLTLYNVPGDFIGKLMIYIDNTDSSPAPAHAAIKTVYYQIFNNIPQEYNEHKDRLITAQSQEGSAKYLLQLGSCYVYNNYMTVNEFNQLREKSEL